MLPLARDRYYGTGRRKDAVAKVWIAAGEGKITVNDKPLADYFHSKALEIQILQPLVATNSLDSFDIYARVGGGGLSGQAGAVRHGISRALLSADPELRKTLRQGGFLTRDPRMKERRKYGLKKARKKPQFSKR